MAANLRLTGKTVAPFFKSPVLSTSADAGQHEPKGSSASREQDKLGF